MASPLLSFPRFIAGAETIVWACQHGYLSIRFRVKGLEGTVQLMHGLDFASLFDLGLIDDDCYDETVFFARTVLGMVSFFPNGWRWDRIFSPVPQ